jgi:hypothetical protein
MMAAKNSSDKASSSAVSTEAGRSWPARHPLLFTFLLSAVIVWGIGTVAYIYFYPRLIYNNAFKKAILVKGFGEGPIPVNTLSTEPQVLFADPLHAPASASNLATTGVNRDTLLMVGWLDLPKGPQVLQVPDMPNRYYSVQFTDPSDGTDFAYVGTRTTGTNAGDYLISGPGWKGAVPQGMTQISSPNNSVLVIGRVLVESDSDLATAYDLSKQIQITPLSNWQPGQ